MNSTQRWRAAFRPLGLTGVQAEAIMALDDVGPVTLKDLSTRLARSLVIPADC